MKYFSPSTFFFLFLGRNEKFPIQASLIPKVGRGGGEADASISDSEDSTLLKILRMIFHQFSIFNRSVTLPHKYQKLP